MKRVFLVQHLIRAGCELTSEEPTHSNWVNPQNDHTAEVPRQLDIATEDAEKIYISLGIANPADSVATIH